MTCDNCNWCARCGAYNADRIDELRAEIERLRAAAGGDEQYRTVSVRDLLRVASAERDELRAEVERLRDELAHVSESLRVQAQANRSLIRLCDELRDNRGIR